MAYDSVAWESSSSTPAPPSEPVALADLRFRALMSEQDWAALPPAVRRRLSRRVADGATTVYAGRVLETRMSRAGFLLAQAARLIGGPLPTAIESDVPSIVTVTEDLASGGQIWTRLYGRKHGFPQVIHSAKRFAGPTGLEEYLGFGVAIALKVGVREGAVVFESRGYFLQIFRRRIRLPSWLTPGVLSATQADHGGGRFVFTLELAHRRLGTLIHQSVEFREVTP
jgi:hypothetical protein